MDKVAAASPGGSRSRLRRKISKASSSNSWGISPSWLIKLKEPLLKCEGMVYASVFGHAKFDLFQGKVQGVQKHALLKLKRYSLPRPQRADPRRSPDCLPGGKVAVDFLIPGCGRCPIGEESQQVDFFPRLHFHPRNDFQPSLFPQVHDDPYVFAPCYGR